VINSKQTAIIKKDIFAIVANKQLLTALIIVPLVFTVFFPTIFILIIRFAPDQVNNIEQILNMLPEEMRTGDMQTTIINFLLDNIMPLFFTIIPILASSIMAASSFVGEKEKRTLETLLYSPLSLTQIFHAKVWASFVISMAITYASFVIMLIVVEALLLLSFGNMILPGLSWLFILLAVTPAMSLLAITLIVRGSAKAQTMEDSQQRSVFLVLPIMLVIVGQFMGIVLINPWYLLIAGAVLGAIAALLMKGSMKKFSYEILLRR